MMKELGFVEHHEANGGIILIHPDYAGKGEWSNFTGNPSNYYDMDNMCFYGCVSEDLIIPVGVDFAESRAVDTYIKKGGSTKTFGQLFARGVYKPAQKVLGPLGYLKQIFWDSMPQCAAKCAAPEE